MVVFASGCSQDDGAVATTDTFLEAVKSRDFKAAHSMLSESDRDAMSADSFYIRVFKGMDHWLTLGEHKVIGTTIRPAGDDTVFVSKVLSRPDFNLMSKMKEDEDQSFEDFVKQMIDARTVPTIVDTVICARLLRDAGGPVVHIGIRDILTYERLLASAMESLYAFVEVAPVRLEVDSYEFSDLKMASLDIRIRNSGTLPVQAIVYGLSVDGKDYCDESDERQFAFVEVPPHSEVATSEYLPSDLKDELCRELIDGLYGHVNVSADRICLDLRYVDFKDSVRDTILQIHRNAIEKSQADPWLLRAVSYFGALGENLILETPGDNSDE